jgi:hypothetical protein
MNNICDDNDDDIMDFLIHDEDDDFTEAIVLIVDNLAEEAADGGNDTTLVPSFVWGSGSRVGKLQTSNVVVFFIRIYFSMIFGALLPFTMQLTSKSSSRCQLDCLMTSWQR